jgi:16S rRNA (guanine527-N7)-methyltransferase
VVDGGAAVLGIDLTAGARAAIDSHARLLTAWNEQINLTALRSPEQIARGHVLDSLAAAGTIHELLERSGRESASRTLLDLGSGGGYPGLPLAATLPLDRCALVDSVQKKAGFLRVAAAAVGGELTSAGEPAPRFEVFAERAEDLAEEPDQRAGWQVVTARAVGSLSEVAELGLPLVADGGHLVAWKTDDSGSLRNELHAARRIVATCGGSRPQVRRIDAGEALGLPGHVLVTIRKSRPTPDRYPRQPTERRRATLLR